MHSQSLPCKENALIQPEQILQEMVETYWHKVDGNDPYVVQLEIRPDEFMSHIMVDQEQGVALVKGTHPEARFSITMSAGTLQRIYDGENSAFVAAARKRISDPAPLDLGLAEGVEFSPALYGQMITFIQRFFWCSDPKRILLGEEHSRLIHGGHATPLFYGSGFRGALVSGQEGRTHQ